MKQIKHINLIVSLASLILFFSCNNNDGFEKYIIKDLSHPCDVLLYASDTTHLPSYVIIHIVGNINGECAFEIENGDLRYEKIKLRDTIDYIYKNEWYDSKINIKYYPDSRTTGDSLVVLYQMI